METGPRLAKYLTVLKLELTAEKSTHLGERNSFTFRYIAHPISKCVQTLSASYTALLELSPKLKNGKC